MLKPFSKQTQQILDGLSKTNVETMGFILFYKIDNLSDDDKSVSLVTRKKVDLQYRSTRPRFRKYSHKKHRMITAE
jgi:hypothetical protein